MQVHHRALGVMKDVGRKRLCAGLLGPEREALGDVHHR
jgi:hypothetical protein